MCVKKKLLTLTFCFLAFLPSCLAQNITPLQADSLLKAKSGETNLVILDVRTPMEYKNGHLENSIMINYVAPCQRRKIWKLDKNKTYLLYCKSGVRSADAMGKMQKREFREVYNLLGGIMAWKRDGLPVIENIN